MLQNIYLKSDWCLGYIKNWDNSKQNYINKEWAKNVTDSWRREDI